MDAARGGAAGAGRRRLALKGCRVPSDLPTHEGRTIYIKLSLRENRTWR